jgi:hypothetical protein
MFTIVDGRGRIWHGSVLADITLKDAGSVALRQRAGHDVEVCFSPDAVKHLALLKAIELLNENVNWKRIELIVWVGEWRRYELRNCPAAIQMMTTLFEETQDARSPRFLFRRIAPAAIPNDPALARIHGAWSTERGIADRGLMEAVRDGSSGRYLEVAPEDGGSRLVLAVVGEGYSLYGNGWKSGAVGGRFEDMPDFEYARSAAQAYREVYRTGQPVFEEVTALVQMMRTGPLLLKYHRAILPIGGGEHPDRLLGATLNQRVTHLAFATDDKLGDVLQ